MSLVSTKREKTKVKDTEAKGPYLDEPAYGYGTRITLDATVLKRIGKSLSDYKVGGKIDGRFQAEIIGVRSNLTPHTTDEGVELQITAIDLGMKSGSSSKMPVYDKMQNQKPSQE